VEGISNITELQLRLELLIIGKSMCWKENDVLTSKGLVRVAD